MGGTGKGLGGTRETRGVTEKDLERTEGDRGGTGRGDTRRDRGGLGVGSGTDGKGLGVYPKELEGDQEGLGRARGYREVSGKPGEKSSRGPRRDRGETGVGSAGGMGKGP